MHTKNEENNNHHSHDGSHCGCGCHHHGNHKKTAPMESIDNFEKLSLTNSQISVLVELHHCKYLPISRFVMSSSVQAEAVFIALAPVYLTSVNETIEDVKMMGTIFTKLAEKGLISLDYDIELSNYDYSLYTYSEVYKHFEQTVAEGKKQKNFLCDISEIELGSMALTALGQRVVNHIMAEHAH